jgi:hypothetical protein
LVTRSFPHDPPLVLELDFAAVGGIELKRHLVGNALQVGGVDGVACLLASLHSLDFVDDLDAWSLAPTNSDKYVDPGKLEKTVLIARVIGCPKPIQFVGKDLGILATASHAGEQEQERDG